MVAELDSFLDEYGERKESKSTFVEEAIALMLDKRKQDIENVLKEKLKKLGK